MQLNMWPFQNGDAGYLCMPLLKNIPEAKDLEWTLDKCPECGHQCWKTPLAKQVLSENENVVALCTECALRKGLKNNAPHEIV